MTKKYATPKISEMYELIKMGLKTAKSYEPLNLCFCLPVEKEDEGCQTYFEPGD